MNTRTRTILLLAASLTLLSGCTTYYQVTDPASSKTYYTDSNVSERYDGNGAVSFTDMKTGTKITLQNSEVKEISKDEFTKATAKPAAK